MCFTSYFVIITNIVNSYPRSGGYASGGYYFMGDTSHQILPVLAVNNQDIQVLNDQQPQPPKQQFFIVPYSRVKSDSSDEKRQPKDETEDESDDNNHMHTEEEDPGNSCDARDDEPNDDSDDEVQESQDIRDSKPKKKTYSDGYTMGWIEKTVDHFD
ncbi:uncharacterized protein LOC128966542 [Oppia nitens]|uniref:uncharacterized protein LOC128966542 n=1 Tax=Oppia nitens TaxID=1686743 RepID=UPI0023DB24E1|nr:uncharacterized protein LOC128966542 [Oppia nitens]